LPEDYESIGDVLPPAPDDLGESGEEPGTDAAIALQPAAVRSFADVVALAGQRRDAKLKIHLEENVSLVRFDASAGSIDIFLLPGAPKELANELREKLNRWTGRRWVVVLSKARGEPTLGEMRREREALELKEIKAHPAVAAVLEEFPDAKITVRRGASPQTKDETGTG
jgi:DNA polymerase-3 subunit gamma/tau